MSRESRKLSRKIMRTVTAAALLAGGFTLLAPNAAYADAKNNVLTIGYYAEPFTLDPAMGVGGTDYPYLYSIFARILTFDPKTLATRPGLAETWQFSDGNKTFTFKLRPNLKFQDGTVLDSAAVKESMLHFKNDGRVQDLEVVDTIETPDPLTVVLKLNKPFSPLTAILADRGGMIISPTSLKSLGKDFDRKPVGAGPFQIKSWTAGTQMELVKNPSYYDAANIKLNGITFKFIANPTSLVSAALTGQVDFAFNLDPKNIPALEANPRLRVAIEPSLNFAQIGVHLGVPPMDNIKVRQALSKSIDRKVLRDVLIGEGRGDLTALPVPSPSFQASEDFAESVKYDPVKAKQLLAEAGYPNGLTLKVCGNNSSSHTGTEMTDMEREQMKAAGITLAVTIMTSSACLQAYNLRGEFPLWQGSFSGRPHSFMTYQQYFGSSGQYNKANTKFPGVDEIIDKIAATDKPEEQAPLFAQLDKLWAEQMPVIPLFFRPQFSVYSRQIAGEQPNAQGKVDPTTIYFIANEKK